MPSQNNSEITIHHLYPDLNEQQLEEAEENLGRYLELILQIHERIRLDPEAYAEFRALTASGQETMMKGRSNLP